MTTSGQTTFQNEFPHPQQIADTLGGRRFSDNDWRLPGYCHGRTTMADSSATALSIALASDGGLIAVCYYCAPPGSPTEDKRRIYDVLRDQLGITRNTDRRRAATPVKPKGPPRPAGRLVPPDVERASPPPPDITFQDMMAMRRWIPTFVEPPNPEFETPKAPAGRWLDHTRHQWDQSGKWKDGGQVEKTMRDGLKRTWLYLPWLTYEDALNACDDWPGTYRPGYCLSGADAPPILVLDIDYKPSEDNDRHFGLDRRNHFYRTLNDPLWGHSLSASGNGRHIVASVHPADRQLWRELGPNPKIPRFKFHGAQLEVWAPGASRHICLTRQWIDHEGDPVPEPTKPFRPLRVSTLVPTLTGSEDMAERLNINTRRRTHPA